MSDHLYLDPISDLEQVQTILDRLIRCPAALIATGNVARLALAAHNIRAALVDERTAYRRPLPPALRTPAEEPRPCERGVYV